MTTGATPTASGTPPAEYAIDHALVARLLADQHPDLTSLPLQELDAGWDNALFRLGDHLVVRLPRRIAAAPLIVHEQTWLPSLADQLSLPIPRPVRVGVPALGYPWHWSVIPWLPGGAADLNPPDVSQARPFAAFLRSLHRPAPADAPPNPLRGIPLQQRAAGMEDRLRRVSQATDLITPQIRQLWYAAVEAPLDLPPTWLHGDLHPRNILVEAGAISGVIDWGDLTSGDPATDLAAIWMLFADRRARADALAAYGALSDATLLRANGWAVVFGVILLDSGLVDSPRHAAIGANTLRRVAESLAYSDVQNH